MMMNESHAAGSCRASLLPAPHSTEGRTTVIQTHHATAVLPRSLRQQCFVQNRCCYSTIVCRTDALPDTKATLPKADNCNTHKKNTSMSVLLKQPHMAEFIFCSNLSFKLQFSNGA